MWFINQNKINFRKKKILNFKLKNEAYNLPIRIC